MDEEEEEVKEKVGTKKNRGRRIISFTSTSIEVEGIIHFFM